MGSWLVTMVSVASPMKLMQICYPANNSRLLQSALMLIFHNMITMLVCQGQNVGLDDALAGASLFHLWKPSAFLDRVGAAVWLFRHWSRAIRGHGARKLLYGRFLLVQREEDGAGKIYDHGLQKPRPRYKENRSIPLHRSKTNRRKG